MITVLIGDNSFEVDRTLIQIKREFDGEAEAIDPYDLPISALPDLLMGVSLFSEKRLIIIRGLSDNKVIWPVMGDWLVRVSNDIHLVLVEPTIDKRTSTYKALKASANIIECPSFSERDIYKLEKWVSDEASKMKLAINKNSIQVLLQRVGPDQRQLFFALEKMLLVGSEINESMINELIPASPSENIFNLFESAINGDIKKLRPLLDSLEQTEDPYRLSALIFSQGFQLAAVSSASDGDDIAKDFGIHPFVVQKMRPIAKKLGQKNIAKLITIMSDTDYQMKTSGSDNWLLLENALYKIAAL